MAPEPAGEGMREGRSTFTLAEAMVVAREKSKLEKRHARYKRYYDSHPGMMQKKNLNGYPQPFSHVTEWSVTRELILFS